MKNNLYHYLLIVMVALLTSCSSYGRSNQNIAITEKGEFYQILYYASLAGSSHNSQPWKVEVYGNDSILVFADMTRRLIVVDPASKELYISIGAFIENLSIAASCYGYETSIKINNHCEDSRAPLASISLSKSKGKEDDSILTEIKQRITLRTPFDTVPIKESDWITLVSIADTCIHYFPSTTEKGKFIKAKEFEAYTEQARNKNAQDELASWIRFSNKDVKEKQDGLTTASMGIKGVGGFVVSNFFKPEDSKKESFVNKGIDKTKLQVENCGGWIVITQKTDKIESWINTGRLYQSINLKCRKLNIGFHPMNQIIEEANIKNEVNQFLGLKGQIMFISRIGYVKNYPAPVSVRRSVESFTTFK